MNKTEEIKLSNKNYCVYIVVTAVEWGIIKMGGGAKLPVENRVRLTYD